MCRHIHLSFLAGTDYHLNSRWQQVLTYFKGSILQDVHLIVVHLTVLQTGQNKQTSKPWRPRTLTAPKHDSQGWNSPLPASNVKPLGGDFTALCFRACVWHRDFKAVTRVGEYADKAFRVLPAMWPMCKFKILSGVDRLREILKSVLHGEVHAKDCVVRRHNWSIPSHSGRTVNV